MLLSRTIWSNSGFKFRYFQISIVTAFCVQVQLFYAPFCGFTAQTIFDPMYITLYNVVFTSFPIMLVGVMDQELSIADAPPEVYEVG